MAVHLITYYMQPTFHEHEGCGCDSHHASNCEDHSHEHNESCGCGENHHEHGENCGCDEDTDYDLTAAIESLGRWAQFMPTAFLVESSLSSDEILDELSSTLGSRDLLFVSKLDSNNVACLTPQVKEWIKKVESESQL